MHVPLCLATLTSVFPSLVACAFVSNFANPNRITDRADSPARYSTNARTRRINFIDTAIAMYGTGESEAHTGEAADDAGVGNRDHAETKC